jgi:peptide/nickel transport system permease protein
MTTVESSRPRRSGTAYRRRTLRDPVAVGCLVVLCLVVAVSRAAPLLGGVGVGVGRDVLSRVRYGGRTSPVGGTLAVLVAFVVGAPLGLVSGFYRGRLAGPEHRHDHAVAGPRA